MNIDHRLISIFKHKASILFIILAGFFIANTIVAEFIGSKIFSLEKLFGYQPFQWTILGVEGLGLSLTAGAILWPVVFVMTDIINEYYGPKAVRFLSYLAIGIVFYAFLMVYGAIGLPPNDWWQYQSGIRVDGQESITDMSIAYNRVMGQGLWIIIGSMIAFLVGQVIDVFVFHKIKKITGENKASGDLFVYPLMLALIIGRIGCFSMGIYEETYGIATTLPWGMNLGDGIARHPVALYEIIFLMALWISVFNAEKKWRFKNGSRFKIFLMSYILFRFLLDFIKPHFTFSFGLSTIQIVCIAGFIWYGRYFVQPKKLLV